MDWTLGKSESVIPSFHYSQTQQNGYDQMHVHRVGRIEVGEDLWDGIIQLIVPVNEKDGT